MSVIIMLDNVYTTHGSGQDETGEIILKQNKPNS